MSKLLYNAEKVARLRERAHQAHITANDLRDRLRDREDRITKLERGLADGSMSQQPTDQDRERVEAKVQPLRDEVAFLSRELAEAQRFRYYLGPVARDVDSWLDELRKDGHNVEADRDAAPADPVADSKRSKHHKRLDELKTEIHEAMARRDTVAAAPLPPDQAKNRIAEWIDREADQARFRQAATLAATPDQMLTPDTFRVPTGGGSLDLAPLFAFACGDQLKAKLGEAVDQLVDADSALSDEQRQAKLAEIDQELDALGREEETLICQLEAAGETIARRANADPRHIAEARWVEPSNEQVAA